MPAQAKIVNTQTGNWGRLVKPCRKCDVKGTCLYQFKKFKKRDFQQIQNYYFKFQDNNNFLLTPPKIIPKLVKNLKDEGIRICYVFSFIIFFILIFLLNIFNLNYFLKYQFFFKKMKKKFEFLVFFTFLNGKILIFKSF